MKKLRKYCIIVLIVGLFLYIKDTKSKYVLDYKYNLDTNISIDKIPPKICVIDKNLDVINNIAIEAASIEYSDELSGIKSATWKYNFASDNFDVVSSNQLESNTVFKNKGWYKIEVEDNAENKNEKIFYLDLAVCRIEERYYRKLKDAINDIKSNKETTITILKDIKENSNITTNKNIVIDLANNTINGNIRIENKACLKVKNGKIENQESVFDVTGNLKIINGEYKSDQGDAIQVSDGSVYIEDGAITADNGNSISINSGEVIINNGIVNNTGLGEIIHMKNGILTMNSGKLINTGINAGIYIEEGTANLNGGHIIHTETSACDIIALGSKAVLNVNGAIIENNTTSTEGWACIASGGTVRINSGEIRNTKYGRAIYSYNGILEIKDGNISNSTANNMITVDSYGKLVMQGGYIISKSDVCTLSTYGNSNIYGGSIINYGKGDALRINSGSANISGGNFEAKEGYAIYKSDGECNVSNATIIGRTLY